VNVLCRDPRNTPSQAVQCGHFEQAMKDDSERNDNETTEYEQKYSAAFHTVEDR